MSLKRGLIVILLALVLAAAGAMFATVGKLSADLRLAALRSGGPVQTGWSGPLTDYPPFRDQLDLAVDAGELDRARVTAALTAPLEAWFGPGNVHLVPIPTAGTDVTRPLLVVRISGPVGPWRPWGVKADLAVESVAVDLPGTVRWPDWTPDAAWTNAARNRFRLNTLDTTDRITVSVSGLLPRWALEEYLTQRATWPIVAHLVAVAQGEAPAPRVPAPPMASPLSVDWSRPFALHCAGAEVPFKVRFDHGTWARDYEPRYVQDQSCDWSFTTVNTTDQELTLANLNAPAFKYPDIVAFGEAQCQAAGEAAGGCAGRTLAPGATLGVRVPMHFDECERYPAGGAVSYRLDQASVAVGGSTRQSLSLPWSTGLTLTRPPDSACPARFPGPATRAAIAAWLRRTLDPAVVAGMPITAEDVVFKDDVLDTFSSIGSDRLGTFVVRPPSHTCVGVARFRRKPDDWISRPSQPGQPLFSERLLAQAVHCVPDSQAEAEGGAGIRVALRNEEGKDFQVAAGTVHDPESTTVELQVDNPQGFAGRLGEITDGAFTFRDFAGVHAGLSTWRLRLRPSAYNSEPSGTLELKAVELAPAAAPWAPATPSKHRVRGKGPR